MGVDSFTIRNVSGVSGLKFGAALPISGQWHGKDSIVKISSSVSSVGSASEGVARTGTAPARAGTPQPPAAQVDLSPLSSRLQAIEASLANEPVVNSERVAAIKQAIAEGRFQINPDRIADGLLSNMRQMLNKQRA